MLLRGKNGISLFGSIFRGANFKLFTYAPPHVRSREIKGQLVNVIFKFME